MQNTNEDYSLVDMLQDKLSKAEKKIKALEHILKDRYKTQVEYVEIEGDKISIELNSEGLNV